MSESDELEHAPAGPLAGFLIGEPCAFAVECELQARDAKVPGSGCTAIIRCTCGQAFRIDLAGEGPHGCPKCERVYTSLVVIAPMDDDGVLQDVIEHLAEVNGVSMGEGDGADDDGAGDDDDDDDDVTEDESSTPGT